MPAPTYDADRICRVSMASALGLALRMHFRNVPPRPGAAALNRFDTNPSIQLAGVPEYGGPVLVGVLLEEDAAGLATSKLRQPRLTPAERTEDLANRA